MLNALIYLEQKRYMKVYEEVIGGRSDNTRIIFSSDPREALYIAASWKPGLMVADLQSVRKGDISFPGFTFLNLIRGQEGCRYTPLIVVSDLEDERYFAYNRLHCHAYFPKPLNKELFYSEVGDLCDFLRRDKIPGAEQLHFFRRKKGVIILRNDELIRYELHRKEGLLVTQEASFPVSAELIRKDGSLRDPKLFIRCNRSDYVNASYIREWTKDEVVLSHRMGRIELSEGGQRRIREYMKRLFN